MEVKNKKWLKYIGQSAVVLLLMGAVVGLYTTVQKDQKQNEAKTMKNTRVFLHFKVFFFRSSKNEDSLFFSELFFKVLDAACRLSFRSSNTGFFNLYQA